MFGQVGKIFQASVSKLSKYYSLLGKECTKIDDASEGSALQSTLGSRLPIHLTCKIEFYIDGHIS